MSGFAPEWLALRESADTAARDAGLVDALRGILDAARPAGGAAQGPAGEQAERVLEVIDLGAGTGANLRYLAPLLGGKQRWLLVDDDPALLHRVAMQTAAAVAAAASDEERAEGAPFKLPDAAFSCDVALAERSIADVRGLPITRRCLVTASALLDLVSAAWLDELAQCCARAGAHVLFALTYDGRIEMAPADEGDELIRTLVNLHQRRDKGFGPALGPTAAAAAEEAFEASGYRVRRARSDWRLDSRDAALQRALLQGFALAARETAPDRAGEIDRWLKLRLEHVEAGRSEVVVGHVDLAAGGPPLRGSG